MATFLTAKWTHLIMAQYSIAPETLTPWLPAGVELDMFQDHTYISLVGFLFHQVRLKGVPIPFHTSFEEINLRFYVKRREADGTVRRGVVFVREFVPRAAITLVARTFYDEPYSTVPTTHQIAHHPEGLQVDYRWKHAGRWHELAVTADPQPQEMVAGGEEEFLTEHYWGYTKRRDGTTTAYEVRHPRWKTHAVKHFEIDADLGMLYGPAFAGIDAGKPDTVLLAEGSAVTVEGATGERIRS